MSGSYNGGFHNFGSGNLSLTFQHQDRLKQESARRIVNASEGGKRVVKSTDGSREYRVQVVAPPGKKAMVPVGTKGPGAEVVTSGDPRAVVAGPGLGVVTSGPAFKPVYQSAGFGLGAFFDDAYAVPGGYVTKDGKRHDNAWEMGKGTNVPIRTAGINWVPDLGWSSGQDFEDEHGEGPGLWLYSTLKAGANMSNTVLHYAGYGGNAGFQKAAQDEVKFLKQALTPRFNDKPPKDAIFYSGNPMRQQW